ncbi:MAG: ATP-binding protein [Micropepsaceae bacterium]
MRVSFILACLLLLCLLGVMPALNSDGPIAVWLSRYDAFVVGAIVFISCFTGMMVAHLGMAHERAEREARDLASVNADLERLAGERTQCLSEKVIELEAARAEAVEANTAKSRFLAAMSHELRTPLNAILGFSEIIQRELHGAASDVRYREYAGFIHQSGSHLLSLIGDILDLSKIEAGKMELHCVPFRVAEVVEEACQLSGARAAVGGRLISVDIEYDLPMLDADRRATAQMVLNLLSNAMKFTPPTGMIEVCAYCGVDGGVSIRVRDSGIGIAKGDIAKVLADYGQATNPEVRKHAGTGLGLPIVSALMALHGGSLELESELGQGTSVTLNFPAIRSLRRSQDALAA